MMKFVVLAAFVATALAQKQIEDEERDLVKKADGSINENRKAFGGVSNMIGELGDSMNGVYDSLNAAAANVRAVDKMQANAADLNGSFKGSVGAANNHIESAASAAEAKFAAAELALEQMMMDLEAEKEQAIHNAGMKSAAAAEVLVGALSQSADDLTDSTNSLKSRLAKHAACAASGSVYNSKDMKCMKLEIPSSETASKVHHSIFTSNDGRDSGYINNRNLKFVKKNDATYMRIWYHDNFRVHGHTTHAQWDVMICDANGNGCAECKDPGKVQHWRWAGHQHNWWMNDHWSASVFGICRKSDNRELKKGTYQLRVRIDQNRNDIYTGHNQHNILMVDEVLKA